MTQNKLTLWQPSEADLLPAKINAPSEIVEYAKQLSIRERKQVIQGFAAENYEIVINFVWTKAMAALKRELGTLGVRFLGEMLDKPDLDEDDDVIDAITDKEAVRLAEELGVVSSTEAMRLRQAHELVAHFSKLEASEIDSECIEMDSTEAVRTLKTCIINILGKPKIEVATKFVEFRDALEAETLNVDDERVGMLVSSPYFFRKLTISILLSVIKKNIGAKLEHALNNFNLLLPLLWDKLRDTEKWQIGQTYAEVYAAGRSTATNWLMQALLKVKGFDYVPENLRSDTFIKAAENVIKAHEGLNNFYTEEAPMKVLSKMGSTIPLPAFSICSSAIISVRLGNYYGVSYSAYPIADKMLDKFAPEQWQYYLNQCLPGDVRILRKIEDGKPLRNWFELVDKHKLINMNYKHQLINKLVSASAERDESKVQKYQKLLMTAYYGEKT